MNNPQSIPDLMPCKGRRSVVKRDYPSAKSSGINSFLIDVPKQAMFLLRHRLQFASFRDLVNLYLSWVNSNTGLTMYAVIKAGETSGDTKRACNMRMRSMREKGLVMIVGFRNKCSIYAPTDKAIKELSELCEGV